MTKTDSVVFPDASPLLLTALRQVERPIEDIVIHDGPADEAALIDRVQGHAIAINNESYFTRTVIEQCPDLRAIVFLGTGASSFVDMVACEEHGVAVHNITGYGDRTVAEHAIGLLFTVYRDIARQHCLMENGGWDGAPIGELHGKTIGLIGLGGIGRETANIALALGMKVLAATRRAVDDDHIQVVDLDTLLAEADIVSLHLALTPETEGMLDASRLRRMKRGAVLINTARGALLDEGEFEAMLVDGHLAGAAVDVYSTEPLPADHPFRRIPNLVLTAHTGWQSPEAVQRLVSCAVDIVHTELDAVR